MHQPYSIALIYLGVINTVTFVVYGIDKWKARHDRWRTSEAALLWLAIAGGSIGAWLGMHVWHHKTQHPKFRYGVPLIMMLHIALAVAVWRYGNNDNKHTTYDRAIIGESTAFPIPEEWYWDTLVHLSDTINTG